MISVFYKLKFDPMPALGVSADIMEAGGSISRGSEGRFLNAGSSHASHIIGHKWQTLNRGNPCFTMGTASDWEKYSIFDSLNNKSASSNVYHTPSEFVTIVANSTVNVALLQAIADRGDVLALAYNFNHLVRNERVEGHELSIAMLIEPESGFQISRLDNKASTRDDASIVWTQATGGDAIVEGGYHGNELTMTDIDGSVSKVKMCIEDTTIVKSHPTVNGDLTAFVEGLVAGKDLISGV
jgi:hypothetical protein